MRHTELWSRMAAAHGSEAYAAHWAGQHVLSALGGRTTSEALDAGESPKRVWLAVHEALGLPAADR
jgi:hypothetical protein